MEYHTVIAKAHQGDYRVTVRIVIEDYVRVIAKIKEHAHKADTILMLRACQFNDF